MSIAINHIWFLIKSKIRFKQIVEEKPAKMQTIEYLGQTFNLPNQKQKIELSITDAMLTVTPFQDEIKESSEK